MWSKCCRTRLWLCVYGFVEVWFPRPPVIDWPSLLERLSFESRTVCPLLALDPGDSVMVFEKRMTPEFVSIHEYVAIWIMNTCPRLRSFGIATLMLYPKLVDAW
jgi:hypothetical protein